MILLHIKVVLTCDNTRGTVPTQCSYSQTIGTQYSTSVTNEMSVSVGVKYAMEVGFEGLFKESLEVSATTGYNWRHESSEAKSKQVTTTVQATAPAGRYTVDTLHCHLIIWYIFSC